MLFSALFSISGMNIQVSNEITKDKEPHKEISAAISQLIKNIEFIQADLPTFERINVKFMFNEKNEIVVLSTDNLQFDYQLKNALNYKKIEDLDKESFKVYIVPIVLKQ